MLSQVTIEELGMALHGSKPPTIVDVREPEEYKCGHIKNALSMPLGKLAREFSERFPDKETRVVLYCDLGIRSNHAARLLRSMGYRHVKEILGGMLSLARHPKSGGALGNA